MAVRVAWTAGPVLAACAALAQPVGPAFDCAKAEGTAEQLICRDPELAARDVRMDEVYRAAMARAGSAAERMRAEQVGWIKGRNDCWKSADASVRQCVEDAYRTRIAELQVESALVPVQSTAVFACGPSERDRIAVAFFETDPRTARLERTGESVLAYSVPSASGARYAGQNVTFWSKGPEATVEWLGAALRCRTK